MSHLKVLDYPADYIYVNDLEWVPPPDHVLNDAMFRSIICFGVPLHLSPNEIYSMFMCHDPSQVYLLCNDGTLNAGIAQISFHRMSTVSEILRISDRFYIGSQMVRMMRYHPGQCILAHLSTENIQNPQCAVLDPIPSADAPTGGVLLLSSPNT
eukprot:83638_1